jgi:hypothetical protein
MFHTLSLCESEALGIESWVDREHSEPMPVSSLSELNRINREFWQEQHVLLESRMRNEQLRKAAFRMINSEVRRRVPVQSQMSLYEAFHEAHLIGAGLSTEQARKAGRAKKTDLLQQLINSIVIRSPRITVTQLEGQLKSLQGAETIEEIGEKTITFARANGTLKEAKRSGLKDRLSRAKKNLNSR